MSRFYLIIELGKKNQDVGTGEKDDAQCVRRRYCVGVGCSRVFRGSTSSPTSASPWVVGEFLGIRIRREVGRWADRADGPTKISKRTTTGTKVLIDNFRIGRKCSECYQSCLWVIIYCGNDL